jgi:arginase family enzyme
MRAATAESNAEREPLARVSASADRFLLHFDVDVVDFLDLPMAGIPSTRRT